MSFKLSQNVSPVGTSYYTCTKEYTAEEVTSVFGTHHRSDGIKVSHEWYFVSKIGRVYTIYDYKMTSLYDSDLPKPEEFATQKYSWHVGAASRDRGAVAFVRWFEQTMDEGLRKKLVEKVSQAGQEIYKHMQKEGIW